jgi:hypothetical protein
LHNSPIMNTILIFLIALLPGCATQRTVIDEGAGGKPLDAGVMSRADPHLDHIFAWIPRDKAKTASVAEALVHIELGRAKDEVGKTLCGGDWLINGAAIASVGPYPSTAPAVLGGYPAWYYHLSQKPGLAGCSTIPAEKLYRELDGRLPPWISVRAATFQISESPAAEIAVTLRRR